MGGDLINKMVPYPDDTFTENYLRELSAKDRKYEILVRLGLETGLRVSDILRLKVKDIKSVMKVKEMKTKKIKNINLSESLLAQTKNYCVSRNLNKNDFVIASARYRRDKPLSRVQAYRVLSSVASKMGVTNVAPHSMRKTYAVNLLRESGSIESVQRALNHKYPDTTIGYLTGKSITEMAYEVMGLK